MCCYSKQHNLSDIDIHLWSQPTRKQYFFPDHLSQRKREHEYSHLPLAVWFCSLEFPAHPSANMEGLRQGELQQEPSCGAKNRAGTKDNNMTLISQKYYERRRWVANWLMWKKTWKGMVMQSITKCDVVWNYIDLFVQIWALQNGGRKRQTRGINLLFFRRL